MGELRHNPLISVMIPVYNAGDTLLRCLQSVVTQTYRPLQIVVVEDCSTDNSGALIDSFIAANNAIQELEIKRINHLRNMGSGASRRDAVLASDGEYICAIDADDWYEPDMIASMVEASHGSSKDIVACESFESVAGKLERVMHFSGSESFSLNHIKMDTLRFSLCTKMVRTSLWKRHLTLSEGVDCWEDLEQLAVILAYKPDVALLRRPLYHYTVNPKGNSLTHSGADRILQQHLLVAHRIMDYFSKNGLDVEYAGFLDYMKFIAKVKIIRHPLLLREPFSRLRRWNQTFPEVNSRIMGMRFVPLKYRILFKCASLAYYSKKD